MILGPRAYYIIFYIMEILFSLVFSLVYTQKKKTHPKPSPRVFC